MIKSKVAIAAMFAMGVAGAAFGATINEGLTAGVLNTIEDQDREAYIDANKDGKLSVGDVFIGFNRVDNFLPKGVSTNNQVYTIISNQIIGFDANNTSILKLGTTTVAGLRLQDLTGNANTAGGLFAVYDRAAPFQDLMNSPPGGASSMFDYINYIVSNGTLRLSAGISAADDYLDVVNNAVGGPIGSSNSTYPTLTTSITVNSFTAGLSILFNNTNFGFADAVVTADALGGLHTNQLGIGNGATRGASGEGNESIWTNVPGYTQCSESATAQSGNVKCGFVTDADFFVSPTVPEPGSLALVGISLLGLVGVRRMAKKSTI